MRSTYHLDDCTPVLGDLGEVQRLGEVDQVEDILLETRSTETLLVNIQAGCADFRDLQRKP